MLEYRERFEDTYKKVLVNGDIVKGTTLGLLLTLMVDKKKTPLENLGISTLVHLGISGLTAGAMIYLDVDEYFVENSEDF